MPRSVAREVSRLPCVRGLGLDQWRLDRRRAMSLVIRIKTPMKASTNPAGADRTLAGARVAPPNHIDCLPAMWRTPPTW